MRGLGPPQNLMVTPPGPMGGVVQVSMNSSFHNPTPYHAFPGGQAAPTMEYCEICRIHGHGPRQCPIMQKYSTVPNTVHCEFCASTMHTTNQCRALDALADRLDRTTFRVNENPQGPGRGRGGGAGGDFRGGRTGGRGPSRCYNCDEQGHLARDCPHPRRPWCSHCRTNGHATEDCPELIAKWEDRVRQRGTNLISSEIKRISKGQFPNLNIVTRGGAKTGVDVDTLPQIQKATPKGDRYDPLKKKLFFKDAIEVFQNIPSHEMQENPPQPTVYPKMAQVPASPPAPRNPVVIPRQPEQPQNAVDLWFQLFSDILGNDQLTEKLCNALYLVLGNEETSEARIRDNLPEKSTQRVQRRKV
jgi:hypothetical protein